MNEHENNPRQPSTPDPESSSAPESGPAPPPPVGQPGAPAWGRPGSGQPVSGQPVSGEPVSGEPVSGQPGSGEPGWGQTSWGQPSGDPPPAGGPPEGRPPWDQPAWSQPTAGHPAVPGQPAPGPRRSGRGGLATVATIAVAVVAAVAGGIAGASIYAAQDSEDSTPEVTQQVVNGPQLDYSSLASIASDVSPSVVSIQIGDFGGSGVVMSEDGYIITNAHVVATGSAGEPVGVKFSNGEIAQATIVGADPRSDIAVVKVDGVSGLTPAQFGNSSEVLVGDTVLAIGSPLGFEGSVTQGIVSALDRTLEPEEPGAPTLSGLLQTDAAINRGNSGGALVNLAGEVVGINTAIAVQNRDDGFLGVGFAIPSDRATEVAEQLIAGEEVQHPFMGVSVAPATGGGALLRQVLPGSPADEAGLQPGDVIVRLGDSQITEYSDLVAAVQAAAVGDTIEVEFERDGTAQTTTITLGDAADFD